MALSADERARYLRHILLPEVGAQGQQKLRAATVAIIGAGGIGSPAIASLAAAGVGRLRIIDPDTVDLSNLQRQYIHRADVAGALKTASARDFVEALNPNVTVEAVNERLDETNAAKLIAGADIVLDGVDRFPPRFALNAATMAARIPLVSAAVGRFSGYLSTFKPWTDKTAPCFRCFMPEEPPDAARCETDGVLGPVPAVLGAMAAMEVLKELLQLGTSLSGRLALYEPLSLATRVLSLPRDPACPDCGGLKREDA